MTSHGILRQRVVGTRSPEKIQKELQEIEEYRDLERSVHAKITQHQYTLETLQQTSTLLDTNPEYYTVWNYRRLVRQDQFSLVASDPDHIDQIVTIIETDLEFLFPLLRRFPKCYWIWNYRLWILNEAKSLLPKTVSRKFWQTELALVGKMLNADNRNFLGWGYRRFVVQALEEFASEEEMKNMTRSELDYTTKMIGVNLSNYSSWHSRTKLIQKLLDEQSASDAERKEMLNEELKLAHRALIDPYDQSLWFYHQNLMCTFDPTLSAHTMAPNLSNAERLEYIHQEREAIKDMLNEAEDCKWIYQALIHCTLLAAKIERNISPKAQADVLQWLNELMKLDPLRKGRWVDFQGSLKG